MQEPQTPTAGQAESSEEDHYEELFTSVMTATDAEGRCISSMFQLLPSRSVLYYFIRMVYRHIMPWQHWNLLIAWFWKLYLENNLAQHVVKHSASSKKKIMRVLLSSTAG